MHGPIGKGLRDVSNTALSLVSDPSSAHITVSFVLWAIDHLACNFIAPSGISNFAPTLASLVTFP